MRWVKESFPPRVRLSWLLMTIRLSASNLAGTARTLVAVGTESDAFMFLTTALAAPRSGMTSPSMPTETAGLAAREVVPAAGLASVPTTVPDVLVGLAGWLAGAGRVEAGAGPGFAGAEFAGAEFAGAEFAG